MINKIVIVASSWSFILFTYIDDAWSNSNQIKCMSQSIRQGCPLTKVTKSNNVYP